MIINNTKAGGQNAYQFIDLVDVPAFARLLEHFFQATGIPNGVVDTNGELLSMSSGENACSMFHRTQSEAADLCRDSNLELVRNLRDGCVVGGLCRNGLMDYATQVVVEGRQLATLFLGQVLHAPPDMEFFRTQAARFGFDEKTYLESIAAIPVVDKKQVDDLMEVMVEMAQMLAVSGLAKLRQTELERDIRVHAERNIQCRDILDFSPVAMGWSENEDRVEYVNRQFTLLFGYTVADLPNLETWYQRAYPDENYRKTVVGPWRRAVAEAHQANKPPPELEADITCKDGSVRSIIIRVAWVGHRRMVSFTDITERKRLQDDLTDSRNFLNRIINATADPIFVKDRQHRWIQVNDAFCCLVGGTRDELIGKSDFDYFPEHEARAFWEGDELVFADGKEFSREEEITNELGEKGYIFTRKTTFTDVHGNLVLVGVISDITERKRMEQELAEREREFRTLAENLPDNIARWDTEGRYLYINPTHERTLEVVAADVIGRPIPESHDRVKAAIAQVAATGHPIYLLRQDVLVDGEMQIHEVNLMPEFDAEGRVISVLGLGRDMTDIRRLQETITAREQEFRSLAESSPDVVIRVDRDLRIRYLNTNMVKFLELGSAKEVIGWSCSELWPDGRFNEIDALRERVVTTGEMESIAVVVPVLGGKKAYHHVISVPERDIDGHIIGTITFGRDITAIRETERRLNSLVENLPGVAYTIRRSAQGELNFPYVSAGVKELYGITPEAAMGEFATMHALVHPDDKVGMETAFAESARTMTPFRVEVRICPLGLPERWLDVRSNPEEQPDGSILWYGLIFDITERKRMEQALAERERELRTLVENIPDNIARYTTDARHAYVSPSLVRVLHEQKENFLGRTPTECSPNADNVEVERRIRAVAATGVYDEMEYTFPISESETRCHLLRFVAERDDANRITGVLGIGTDITERRNMELNLAAREREFRTLAEHLPDVVVRYDREARFAYVNTKFEAALGFRLTELRGKSPTQVPGLPDAEYFEQMVRQVAETGSEVRCESEITTLNGGSFYGLIRATPEFDNAGQMEFIQVVIRDITERRRIEQRTQMHDAMLEMVARDSDLPTILNALVQYIESEDQTSLCSIMLADAAGKHLLVGAAPSLPVFFNEAANGIEIGVGVGSCGTAAALAQRVVVEDIQTHEYWSGIRELAQSTKLRACWSEPILSSRSKVLGTFSIYHREPRNPQPQDIERIAFATNLAAIAIENRQVHDELERQAHSDYLTGLENRRHFLSQAENELARTLRYGRELSIMMLDVDHFKQVNDTYGHKVGDLVLKRLAELCRATLRDVDIVGRIGGEEFAVLLPETSSEHAKEAAERLCAEIASAQVKLDSGLPLRFTVSFGVTTLCENDANIDILLDQADQALYRAKEEGRNRVCIYPGADERPI